MSDNKTVFDDIMEALHEVEEHQKGNIKLKSNTLIVPDEEVGAHQLFFQKFDKLSELKKQKISPCTFGKIRIILCQKSD